MWIACCKENRDVTMWIACYKENRDVTMWIACYKYKPEQERSSSSSRSSDGNFSLPDEGGSTSQVPQATVKLAGYGSVVWPDSIFE